MELSGSPSHNHLFLKFVGEGQIKGDYNRDKKWCKRNLNSVHVKSKVLLFLQRERNEIQTSFKHKCSKILDGYHVIYSFWHHGGCFVLD